MATAIILFWRTSVRRLRCTSTNDPHTIQSRLTTLGRPGRKVSQIEGIKTAGATIAALGETIGRLDARNGAMQRRGIAAFRCPMQVFLIFGIISETGAYEK